MKRFSKTTRMLILALMTVLFTIGLVAGCGSAYIPVKDGVCSPGRTWVPPQERSGGGWKAGYCTDAR